MAINRPRLLAELRYLEGVFGEQNVIYPADISHILIRHFRMPANWNQSCSNILVIPPDGAGYGAGFKEIYLNLNLQFWKDGRWHSPRYYSAAERGYHNGSLGEKGWRYVCITDGSPHLVVFLKQVELYLSAPFDIPSAHL